jgi:hypothetical protein
MPDFVPQSGELVDAATVARYLGVERSYVYEHAVELGARRLGTGPKARLRFSLAEIDERISCSTGRGSESDVSPAPVPIRRRRGRRDLGTSVRLLPIRGRRPLDRTRSEAAKRDEKLRQNRTFSSLGMSVTRCRSVRSG